MADDDPFAGLSREEIIDQLIETDDANVHLEQVVDDLHEQIAELSRDNRKNGGRKGTEVGDAQDQLDNLR